MSEEDLSISENQIPVAAQDPAATEDVSSSSSSTSSSSSSAMSSSASLSSSCFPHLSSSEEEVSTISATLSPLRGPERACRFPTVSVSVPSTQSDGGSGSTVEAGLGTSQVLSSFPSIVIYDNAPQLVAFLLLKYHTMERTTTRVEMPEVLGLDHQDQFPVIFSCISECLQLAFGIDVKEVDPSDHSYILVTAPGLTYSGQLSYEHSLPKSSLLLFLLTIIYMEGDWAPEEKVWGMLGVMVMCPGREHVIFGDPRELITRVWVQEQYLEYQQVPDSDPTHFHLLWGRRAHMETDMDKVLEFMAKVKDSTANACLPWYEEDPVADLLTEFVYQWQDVCQEAHRRIPGEQPSFTRLPQTGRSSPLRNCWAVPSHCPHSHIHSHVEVDSGQQCSDIWSYPSVSSTISAFGMS
ncbi:melanoma-associated antigen 10-like [Manis pentadactyla]|uniref:melanoma-associated antigen 10-like n=1 Tax=Manis pentadactyla TaxID=143292 RepID=UPI00255CE039|nr:melanoma-associated antigen 10-like [Manis pentadactyla]